MVNEEIKKALSNWPKIVSKYQKTSITKAISQILSSFLPFLGLWVLMYYSLEWSYWITLGLAVINAFFLVRIFIIQHDCGHYSFFKKREVNNVVGYICSFFSSIPYDYWAKSHGFHHGHCGQLEHREIGDIHTMTVKEYRESSTWQRIGYRIFRHPIVMFGFGPLYYLLIPLRLPMVPLKGWKKAKRSQLINNVAMFLVYVGFALLIGWDKFLLVQVPITVFFGSIAVWFFYVQHQHEETYKQWKDQWEYLLAAIKGSTYYKLPRVINWMTGNIGFHHIHHLNPKIPNYNLEKCAKENPILDKYVTKLTLWQSFKCMFNHLWDEENERMISFWAFHRLEKAKVAA